MKRFYGAHSSVFAVAEHVPRAENFVTLARVKDSDDMPKAEVFLDLQDKDLRLLEIMLKKCNEVASASGVKVVGTFTSLDTMGSTHVAGTARMGTNSKNSVVNSLGQCHDVRNLFISDASMLVTQGCGDSPSLTIMALSLRTAEHVASELKSGSL